MQAIINSAVLNKLHDQLKSVSQTKYLFGCNFITFWQHFWHLQIERADVMGSKIKGGEKDSSVSLRSFCNIATEATVQYNKSTTVAHVLLQMLLKCLTTDLAEELSSKLV